MSNREPSTNGRYIGAALAISPPLLLGLILLALHSCEQELPVPPQQVVGVYLIQNGDPEAQPRPCFILKQDGTFISPSGTAAKIGINASGKWKLLSDQNESTIELDHFAANIFRNSKTGAIVVDLSESFEGYNCVKN